MCVVTAVDDSGVVAFNIVDKNVFPVDAEVAMTMFVGSGVSTAGSITEVVSSAPAVGSVFAEVTPCIVEKDDVSTFSVVSDVASAVVEKVVCSSSAWVVSCVVDKGDISVGEVAPSVIAEVVSSVEMAVATSVIGEVVKSLVAEVVSSDGNEVESSVVAEDATPISGGVTSSVADVIPSVVCCCASVV